MDVGARQRIVGAALITLVLGVFAVAIIGWPHGIISAGLIAVALIVAKNL